MNILTQGGRYLQIANIGEPTCNCKLYLNFPQIPLPLEAGREQLSDNDQAAALEALAQLINYTKPRDRMSFLPH